jgi:hypothetical protein
MREREREREHESTPCNPQTSCNRVNQQQQKEPILHFQYQDKSSGLIYLF